MLSPVNSTDTSSWADQCDEVKADTMRVIPGFKPEEQIDDAELEREEARRLEAETAAYAAKRKAELIAERKKKHRRAELEKQFREEFKVAQEAAAAAFEQGLNFRVEKALAAEIVNDAATPERKPLSEIVAANGSWRKANGAGANGVNGHTSSPRTSNSGDSANGWTTAVPRKPRGPRSEHVKGPEIWYILTANKHRFVVISNSPAKAKFSAMRSVEHNQAICKWTDLDNKRKKLDEADIKSVIAEEASTICLNVTRTSHDLLGVNERTPVTAKNFETGRLKVIPAGILVFQGTNDDYKAWLFLSYADFGMHQSYEVARDRIKDDFKNDRVKYFGEKPEVNAETFAQTFKAPDNPNAYIKESFDSLLEAFDGLCENVTGNTVELFVDE